MSDNLPEQWDRIAVMRSSKHRQGAGERPAALPDHLLSILAQFESAFTGSVAVDVGYLSALARYGLKMHEQGRPGGAETIQSLRDVIAELEADRQKLGMSDWMLCGECDVPYGYIAHAHCPYCGEG